MNEDYVSKRKRSIVIAASGAIIFLIAWLSAGEIQDFNRVYDPHTPPENQLESVDWGNVKVTKIEIGPDGEPVVKRFVTLMNLSKPAHYTELVQHLEDAENRTVMAGLDRQPSFLIGGEHHRFWKSQFYLEFIASHAGVVLFLILAVAACWYYFRYEEKYFTREFKLIINGFAGLVIATMAVQAFLYGRIIHFLNKEFNLGEKVTAGFETGWIYLLIAVVYLVAFIEKGVPIQEEQDLTV